jgi:energy-coupling factor transporter ATP-binding protein EcfA2
LAGPRQCGKTTLAKEISGIIKGYHLDLEDPETPRRPDLVLFRKNNACPAVHDESGIKIAQADIITDNK